MLFIRLIKKTLPFIFLLSLVFSVFNISINGLSLYFYLLVPFFDLIFLRWFVLGKHKAIVYFSSFLFVFSLLFCICFGFFNFIKPFLLFVSVVYVYYLYHYRYSLFKLLYVFVSISIIVALIQFVFSYLGYESLVYPSTISKFIWGSFAIQARDGFADGLIFTYRVAGLSKEPGFFSSLLLSVLMIYLVDKKFISKLFVVLLCFGFLVSMSKITLIFSFLVSLSYFIHKCVFNLDKINIFFGALMLLMLQIFVVGFLYDFFNFELLTYRDPSFSETYLHRSIGFYLLYNYFNPVVQGFVFSGGINGNLNDVLQYFPFLRNLQFVYTQPDMTFFSSNFAYIILQYGFFVFLSVLLFLMSLNVGFFSFFVFTLLIANVNMFCLENWVVLGYVFMLLTREIKLNNFNSKLGV